MVFVVVELIALDPDAAGPMRTDAPTLLIPVPQLFFAVFMFVRR
jgi:hypothetical protein